ncbi:alpha/beta fold hydrolase [Pedobacter lithocola]|uniref:Alpha/beta fold hydrolase n=1 Tax=Pedobacter lithocola TaxID=1908239 RepID=A0ABV8P6Q2_9SPHI
MKNQKFEVFNEKGYKLQAYLNMPPNHEPMRFAVLAHCFTCNSDITAVRSISKALNSQGFGVVRFDFTGLGKSEGSFAESHFSANVSDLICVYEYIKAHFHAPELLIGHSLGGAAVIAAASELSDVRAIAAICTPSHVEHVKKHFVFTNENSNSSNEIEVNIGCRPFLISQNFLDEMQKTDLLGILAKLHKPILILHSPFDKIVGIENARELYDRANHPKSFISLDNADHLLTEKVDSEYVGNVISSWANRYIPTLGGALALDTKGEQVVGHLDLVEDKFTTILQTVKHSLTADEPITMGGDDHGPSPYEYLSTALAACTAMTVGLYARRKSWELKEVFVYVSYYHKHMDDMSSANSEPGHIDFFSKKLHFVGDLSAAQKERLREIAAKCPVHKTLSLPVEIETILSN